MALRLRRDIGDHKEMRGIVALKYMTERRWHFCVCPRSNRKHANH
jgi:hypothetical protein